MIRIKSPGAKDQTAKTIRISPSAEAKKVDVSPPEAPQSGGEGEALKPKTLSVSEQQKQEGAAPDPKRQTSRVPLESATAIPQNQDSATKTIRIKPKTPSGKPSSMSALNTLSGENEAPRGTEAAQAKRQTSRISLEDALSSGEKRPSAASTGEDSQPAAQEGAPKTIRLRKPDQTPTVDAQPSEATAAAGKSSAEDSKSEMGKTARLDVPAGEEDEGPTPTRRKTIRVKRPGARSTVSGAGATAPQAGVAPQPPVTVAQQESMHWIFPTVTILSMLVLLTVIYMFAAQTFGPLVSGTQTSYALPELNLPWPGKIQNLR